MAFIQVTVFDRTGEKIGEIRPYVQEVAWRRNDFGRARFTMVRTDSRATERFLRIGNRILFEFDNGLPNWGGVIEVPREWPGGARRNQIDLTAYSGEFLLYLRQTDRGRYFTGATVGNIAQKLVEEANAIRDTGLTVGEIWAGGSTHGPDYHYKNLYQIFTQSLFSRLSTADFEVVPSVVAGKIVFTLNVYERKGSDKPGVALHEGMNVDADGLSLSEQGPIWNNVTAVGNGQDWSEERLTANSLNQDSIDKYDLRETAVIANGVTSPITLQARADTEVANSAQPHNFFTIMALNQAPGQFKEYDIGDVVTAELPSYGFGGFRGNVKILGRTFFPLTGTCDLATREEV